MFISFYIFKNIFFFFNKFDILFMLNTHSKINQMQDFLQAYTRLFHPCNSAIFSPCSEEDVMDMEENLPSQDCRDATDLICGLIRELSSLKLVTLFFYFVSLCFFFLPFYLHFFVIVSVFHFFFCNNLDNCFLFNWQVFVNITRANFYKNTGLNACDILKQNCDRSMSTILVQYLFFY